MSLENHSVTNESDNVARVFHDIDACTVFAFDKAFVKYFSVALASFIRQASTDKQYDIICFHTDIDKETQQILTSQCPSHISLRFLDVSPAVQRHFSDTTLKAKGVWPVAIYYRLLIPLILRQYQTVLYLDSDILISAPIDALLLPPQGDEYASCVKNCMGCAPELFEKDVNQYLKPLSLKHPENYFNSGVMCFYPNNIDADDFKKQVKSVLSTYPLRLPDQDCLNIVFDGNIRSLHPKYNLTVHTFPLINGHAKDASFNQAVAEAMANPTIIHFTTTEKPWKSKRYPFYDRWWKMAQQSIFYQIFIEDYNKQKKHHLLRYYLHQCLAIFSEKHKKKAQKHQLCLLDDIIRK